MRAKITTLILTKNEELHIERCINSVSKISDEIIVVDSHSTDRTVTIAKRLSAEVYTNVWVNYAQQFSYGMSLATNPWILRIDADEYIDSELVSNIQRFLDEEFSNSCVGYYFDRYMFFSSQPVHYGGLFPAKMVRLFDKRHGHIEQRWMDEHIVLDGPSLNLKGRLIDDNLNSISWWVEKHNSYAAREAADFLNSHYGVVKTESTASFSLRQDKFKRLIKEKVYYKMPANFRATLYYLYRMIFRLGILDSQAGRQFHFLQGYWYRVLVDCKITETQRKIESGLTPSIAIQRLLNGE